MTPEALREWRGDHGLSQRQLAEALGVSLGTVRDWEQGRFPTPGILVDLALATLDKMIGPPRIGPIEIE